MSQQGVQRYMSKFGLSRARGITYTPLSCDPMTGPEKFPILTDDQILVAEIEAQAGSSEGEFGVGLYRCRDMADIRNAIWQVQHRYYTKLHGWGILQDPERVGF